MTLSYRILNAFSVENDDFSGSPVCVVEHGGDLSDQQRQALAGQLGIETAFILRADDPGDVDLAYHSPVSSSGFAASIAMSAAQVVRDLHPGADTVRVHGREGRDLVLHHEGRHWTYEPPPSKAEPIKGASPGLLAELAGLSTDALSGEAMRVQTAGAVSINLPVSSPDDVLAAHLNARMLHSYAMLINTQPQVYVWADAGQDRIEGRMFYGPRGGVQEMPATGTGSAGLGAWMVANGQLGTQRYVHQGSSQRRPSAMYLTVTDEAQVLIAANVVQVAQGTFDL